MRYCPKCQRINEGRPERCRFCGSTWGTRYCRRGHPNPPDAVFCGECGSADLSQTAGGGSIINSIFGIGRHRHLIWLLIKIALPILLILMVAKNPEYFLPFVLPIFILFLAFRFAMGIIPAWLIKPLIRIIKPKNKSKNRVRRRESREA